MVHGQVVGPLVINPIADTNIAPGTTLTITVSVTNTLGFSANSLLWTLPGGPAGASITNSSTAPNAALFTWQPSAPTTNTLIVQVQDQFDLTNATSTSFRVFVFTNAVASPPVLTLPFSETSVGLGGTLTFTASARTTDGTTNALTFSLDPDAPANASINAASGAFTWTPTVDQTGDSTIGVIVTENSNPPLTDEQFVTVSVVLTNNCAGYDDFVAAVTQGGVVTLPDCPVIVLSDTLIVANDTTIDAGDSSVMIAGNNLLRLFTVLSPATLTLNGLTLSGGQETNGGAIFVEAGAQAVISDCIFQGNVALGTNGLAGADGSASSSGIGGSGKSGGRGIIGWGGAIFNAGDVTLSSCQFLTNRATGGNGGNGGAGAAGVSRGGDGGSGGIGATALGGAVYNSGTISLADCTFAGNTAVGGTGGAGGAGGSGPYTGLAGVGGAGAPGSGAAIYCTLSGTATIERCTFANNSGTGGNSASGGTLSSGFGSNGARGGDSLGGGVCCIGPSGITNCTFFANSVNGGNGGDGGAGPSQGGNGGNGGNGLGGGVYGSNDVSVINCTIAQNQATGGTNGVAGNGPYKGSNGTPGVGRGAGVARSAGMFFLQNSILVTNAPGTNAYGTMIDGGNNLSSDASLKGTSRKNIDPKLNALAGDPPQTMALKPASPAIDAADDSVAPETDERGTARPVGPHSDIGAYEYPTILAPQITSSPSDQTVFVGSKVTLAATATGDPTLSYQWQFYATNIPGATKSTFTITNAQPSNSGPYTISVSNRLGIVISPPATLTVCPPFSISGHVFDGTNGLSGVTITADTNSAVTDLTGSYNLSNVVCGNYFVFAAKTGYRFSAPQEVILGPSAANIDFTVAAPVYTISGRVLASGTGLSGVTVSGARPTDNNGAFSLSVPAGTNIVLTPSKTGYNFIPASRTVTVPPDATNQDFVAGWLISSIVRQSSGAIQFFVTGSGKIRIESSSNLVNWVSIYTNTGMFSFTDSTAAGAPTRFYRAVQP